MLLPERGINWVSQCRGINDSSRRWVDGSLYDNGLSRGRAPSSQYLEPIGSRIHVLFSKVQPSEVLEMCLLQTGQEPCSVSAGGRW